MQEKYVQKQKKIKQCMLRAFSLGSDYIIDDKLSGYLVDDILQMENIMQSGYVLNQECMK